MWRSRDHRLEERVLRCFRRGQRWRFGVLYWAYLGDRTRPNVKRALAHLVADGKLAKDGRNRYYRV